MKLAPGDRFGRYQIEHVLGEGGMGRVYRAVDTTLRRPVALKLLRQDASPDSARREKGASRLLAEARAAAALDHVNAIGIYDVGEVDGASYIAMELVEGRSLRAYIGEAGTPLRTKVRWLADAARALSAAHARGLVHRDVKPENVMVRRDGVVKVLDFGIAFARDRDATSLGPPPSQATGSTTPWTASSLGGGRPGTPRYMAPEQIDGEEVDGRADQFAWGVLAYELLVGAPPWPGDPESYTTVLSVLSDPPRRPTELAPDIPEALEAVVLRTLATAKGDRFASMGEVVERLDDLFRGDRPEAQAQEATETLRRRRPARWLGLAALAIAAVAASGVALWARAPGERPSAAALPIPESAALDAASAESPDHIAARDAYATGLQHLREGSHSLSLASMMRAIQLEPDLVAAHLRIGLFLRNMTEDDPLAYLARARKLRELLTPHDAAVLHAFEAIIDPTRVDEAETQRRFSELRDLYPSDAEVQYLLAVREDDVTKEIPLLDHVLVLDPGFALAAWRKSVDTMLVMDRDGSRKALEQCLAIAPGSTSCLGDKALMLEDDGRCAEMEATARALLAQDASFRTYDHLARALLAEGKPRAAVREALALKWSGLTGNNLLRYQLLDQAHLDILDGDFVAAESKSRSVEQLMDLAPFETNHADAAWPLIDLLQEMGRDDRAAEVANRFLLARGGWKSAGRWSPRPLMFAAAVRGGLRTQAERLADFQGWLGEWQNTGSPRFKSQWWVHGCAIPAMDAADARAALLLAPSPLPMPTLIAQRRVGIGAAGKVYLLAGRFAEAVPLLQQAAATCSALPAPIDQTRAHAYLGEALEHQGRTKEACEAYGVVMQRWGAAKPRSVTADRIAKRVAALACPKP